MGIHALRTHNKEFSIFWWSLSPEIYHGGKYMSLLVFRVHHIVFSDSSIHFLRFRNNRHLPVQLWSPRIIDHKDFPEVQTSDISSAVQQWLFQCNQPIVLGSLWCRLWSTMINQDNLNFWNDITFLKPINYAHINIFHKKGTDTKS